VPEFTKPQVRAGQFLSLSVPLLSSGYMKQRLQLEMR
jgi:hypothetical protein